jgi:hypothetical protein
MKKALDRTWKKIGHILFSDAVLVFECKRKQLQPWQFLSWTGFEADTTRIAVRCVTG